jgi:predicted ATPase with chaperone activity
LKSTPADVRKEGPSFDLPIALGMLKLEENNRLPDLDAFCISGELALSGQLHPFAFRQLRRQLAAALPTVSLPAFDSSFTTEATSRP